MDYLAVSVYVITGFFYLPQHNILTFEKFCKLSYISGISGRHHVTNEEATRRAGVERLHDIVLCRRWRLAGLTLRLSRDRLVQVAMEWVHQGVNRKRGLPTKTWRKTFNEDLAEMDIAIHCSSWWKLVPKRTCGIKSKYKQTSRAPISSRIPTQRPLSCVHQRTSKALYRCKIKEIVSRLRQ